MELYKILFLIVLGLFIYEYIRHGLTRKMVKYAIVLIILLFFFMIIANYVDLGSFFSKDSTFSSTGAVIIDTTKDIIYKIDFTHLFNKASEIALDATDKVKDILKK